MKEKAIVKNIPVDTAPQMGYPESAQLHLDWTAAQMTCPDWFRDGKFGIFFHWGPYCVPEFQNEWYSRNMYEVGHPANAYHEKNYGSIREFGYKNLINMFTGEHFDAEKWVELFAGAGAKYFVASAEHADGFSMWDSDINPVNSVNYGIGRDIIGELKNAAERHDIKFGASLHHSWNWGWFNSTDPYADVYNPQNQLFYGKAAPFSAAQYYPEHIQPDDDFQQNWLTKCKEIVCKYLPDTIYFDGRLHIIDEKYRLEFAEYYKKAAASAKKEVVFTYKDRDMHPGSGLLDFECRWADEIIAEPWQLDDKAMWQTWCHVKGCSYKSSKMLIHQMIDTVSKNGNFLLNIGPKKDGTFPDEAVLLLGEIGAWLKINGEGIYGTRPFDIFGEGPTLQKNTDRGIALPEHFLPFTFEDIRFTRKENSVFAFLLGWPASGKAEIRAFGKSGAMGGAVEKIGNITMLGVQKPLDFFWEENGLIINLPDNPPCEAAYTIKIDFL